MIDVDERGTEAAAATVALVTKSALSVDEEVIEFKADKPFTYYILDGSGKYIFCGTVCKKQNNKKAPFGAFFVTFFYFNSFSYFCFLWHNGVIHFVFFSYFQKRLQA